MGWKTQSRSLGDPTENRDAPAVAKTTAQGLEENRGAGTRTSAGVASASGQPAGAPQDAALSLNVPGGGKLD